LDRWFHFVLLSSSRVHAVVDLTMPGSAELFFGSGVAIEFCGVLACRRKERPYNVRRGEERAYFWIDTLFRRSKQPRQHLMPLFS
jgi:hypothetical protein